MSQAYEEIVEGESVLRLPPGARHEAVCDRLQERLRNCLQGVATSRMLAVRTLVELTPGTMLRPDLTLVTAATGKAWLVVEIISSDDHRTDTVVKKQIYEDLNVPRLWMVDPRYNNVEVYHASQYGLTLKGILAHREKLTESLLPGFEFQIAELFSQLPDR
jgi:Uma2 family endonuclease